MQEPSSTKTSDAKTRIVPVSYPKMTVKLRPLRNGRMRLTCHTAKKLIWLIDMSDQEALALQAAINDALIELDNEAYNDNVRR